MRSSYLSLALVAVVACGGDDSSAYTPSGTGPAAKVLCDSSGQNAFDTYGTTAFVAVNQAIFANVGAEITANSTTNLGDSFAKVGTGVPPSTSDNAAMFEGSLAAFLVYVYGGPDRIEYTDGNMYNGMQDMVTAHTGLNITSPQYDYFVTTIIVPALMDSGVAMQDVSSCFAPPITSAAFKATIVGL